VNAELMGADSANDFCVAAMENLIETKVKAIRDKLLQYGIGVKSKRGFLQKAALIECLQAERCPTVLQERTADADDERAHNDEEKVAIGTHVAATTDLTQGDQMVRNGDQCSDLNREKYRTQSGASYGSSSRAPGIQGLMNSYGSR
jgi:hypothetical protein